MEVYRVLKPAGTLWLNLGDSYNGSGKCNGGDLSNCLQSSNKEAQKTKPTWVKGLKKGLNRYPVAGCLRPALKRLVTSCIKAGCPSGGTVLGPSRAAEQPPSLPGNWSGTL